MPLWKYHFYRRVFPLEIQRNHNIQSLILFIFSPVLKLIWHFLDLVEEGINLASVDMLLLTILIIYDKWAIPAPLFQQALQPATSLCKTPELDSPRAGSPVSVPAMGF